MLLLDINTKNTHVLSEKQKEINFEHFHSFPSSDASDYNEYTTFRSLIHGGCGIVGSWKKYRKITVRGVRMVEGLEKSVKCNNQGWGGILFFLSFFFYQKNYLL